MNYEDGTTGLGLDSTKHMKHRIKDHDHKVRIFRNKMEPQNSRKYKGPERSTVRRDEAQKIYRLLTSRMLTPKAN